MQILRVSCLIVAMLLSGSNGVFASPVTVCNGYVTHHYDSSGNIINTIISCSGSCSSCEEFSSGDFAWCQCTGGGGTGGCVTVKIDFPGTNEDGARCADVAHCGHCTVEEIHYSNPESGDTYVESHCTGC